MEVSREVSLRHSRNVKAEAARRGTINISSPKCCLPRRGWRGGPHPRGCRGTINSPWAMHLGRSGLLEGRLSCATCSRVRTGQFSSVHYVMQHLPCDRGSALRGAHAAPPPAFRARVRDTGRRWPAIRQCSWQPWRMEYTSISAARQAEQLRQRLPNYPFMHSGSRAQAH